VKEPLYSYLLLISPRRVHRLRRHGGGDQFVDRVHPVVGAPFDFHFYKRDSLAISHQGRIEAANEYLVRISSGWGDALQSALDSLPDYDLDADV